MQPNLDAGLKQDVNKLVDYELIIFFSTVLGFKIWHRAKLFMGQLLPKDSYPFYQVR